MAQSTTKRRPTLWLHKATGRWTKKVHGKFWHFGNVKDDPKGDKSEARWHEEKDDILAGRNPRVVEEITDPDALTVAELCDRFLQHKDEQLAAGEITQRTRRQYKQTTDRIVACFGKTPVTKLTPVDFRRLKATLPGGTVTRGNEIARIRVVFNLNWSDDELLQQRVRFGKNFKKPSRKELRLARAARGPKMIQAADLRRILAEADVHVKAMIYLGLNAGFGNNDVGMLPLSAVDLKRGWVQFARPKTGAARRCKMWPQTIAALQASLDKRPKPKTPAAKDKVFVTRCGDAWAKSDSQNPVSCAFAKILKKLELYRRNVGFYCLRHVFRTIAGGANDLEATRLIMGHISGHVEDDYIEGEGISDERIERVVEHVRKWLGEPAAKEVAHA